MEYLWRFRTIAFAFWPNLHAKRMESHVYLGLCQHHHWSSGSSDATFGENRTYQEALLPYKIVSRVFITHRFRYEQRWVENQDFRTRLRYNLFINVTLNAEELNPGVFYAAFYNELFMNGERSTGNAPLELFDRNRT